MSDPSSASGFINDDVVASKESSMSSLSTSLFVSILLVYILLGFKLEQAKKEGRSLWMHESGPAILLGAALGVIVSNGGGIANQKLEISDTTFFYFVLPPIIFAQGKRGDGEGGS